MADALTLFPVQIKRGFHMPPAKVRESVYMRAYEVYTELYGPQAAMIEGSCRGGFSAGELIAFLYASGFPKEQWSQRANEAFKGMAID